MKNRLLSVAAAVAILSCNGGRAAPNASVFVRIAGGKP